MPDAGEGLTEADILTWHVAPGDAVAVNQVLVEIETAKAAVELPSPWAGTVTFQPIAIPLSTSVGHMHRLGHGRVPRRMSYPLA